MCFYFWLPMLRRIGASICTVGVEHAPISSIKVRWYGFLTITSIVLLREPIPFYAVAAPSACAQVIKYPFHSVFLGFILFYFGFSCVTVFGVSTHRAAFCGFKRSFCSASGICCLSVPWHLVTVVPCRPFWLGFFLVRILPPLFNRRCTVGRYVA